MALIHWFVQLCDLAQPRNHSIVTRPLTSREGVVWARDYWSVCTRPHLYA